MKFKKEILFIYWVAGTVVNPSEEKQANILFSASSESGNHSEHFIYLFIYLHSLLSTSTFFPKHLLWNSVIKRNQRM